MPNHALLYSPKQFVVNDLPPIPYLWFKEEVKIGNMIKSQPPAPWQSSKFRKSGEARTYNMLLFSTEYVDS